MGFGRFDDGGAFSVLVSTFSVSFSVVSVVSDGTCGASFMTVSEIFPCDIVRVSVS